MTALRLVPDGDLVVDMTNEMKVEACDVECRWRETRYLWGHKRVWNLEQLRAKSADRPRVILTVWLGGHSPKMRAQPDEAWIGVRVESLVHLRRDGSECAPDWTVTRKVSFRDGAPDARGSGHARHKARFMFEGQGSTLDEADDECLAAESYLRRAESAP